MRRLLFLSIFAATASLMFLEIFAVRVIAISLDEQVIYYVISIAMLGMGSAGAISTLAPHPSSPEAAARRAFWFAIGAAAATLAFFLGLSAFAGAMNVGLDRAIAADEHLLEPWTMPPHYLAALQKYVLIGTVLTGALLYLPYLFFGLYLTTLFRAAAKADVSRMYAMDLVGACLGAVLVVLALEYASFSLAAGFVTLLPLGAAALIAAAGDRPKHSALAAGLAALFAIAFIPTGRSSIVEPKPHLASLARTPIMYIGYEARELFRMWTSYGRLAAVELKSPNDPYTQVLIAHGGGEGHARVFPYDGDVNRRPEPLRIEYAVRLSTVGCKADGRILVLLAGAGADMVLYDRFSDGKADITGVELLEDVFKWPASQPEYGLGRFFAKPNIRMVAAEGREFLARDRTLYDCILFSWPGASRGYFTGVSAAAPAYLQTREGLTEILDHLAPGGQLTMLAGDRATMTASFIEILRSKGRPALDNVFAVSSMAAPDSEYEFYHPKVSNTQFLLVKPDGFTGADIDAFRRVSGEYGLYSIYDPYARAASETVYGRLIAADDPFEFLNGRLKEHGVSAFFATDDKPFADDPFPTWAYATKAFWTSRAGDLYEGRIGRIWKLRLYHVGVIGGLTAAAIFLIAGPLWLAYRGETLAGLSIRNHMLFFASIGAAYMFVQLGLIHKLRLLIGHPGLTLAIVLASMILFTGVGSFLSDRWFARGVLTFRRAAFAAVAAVLVAMLLIEALTPALVGAPRAVKLASAFAFPAIPSLFMGQLFPQALSALAGERARIIPICMGANALAGTIAAGLGVALAPVIGFSAIMLLGVAFYLIVLAMPHHQRAALRGEAATEERRAVPAL
jgi:hypothetical protein